MQNETLRLQQARERLRGFKALPPVKQEPDWNYGALALALLILIADFCVGWAIGLWMV